jgi:hypothetical protein
MAFNAQCAKHFYILNLERVNKIRNQIICHMLLVEPYL